MAVRACCGRISHLFIPARHGVKPPEQFGERPVDVPGHDEFPATQTGGMSMVIGATGDAGLVNG